MERHTSETKEEKQVQHGYHTRRVDLSEHVFDTLCEDIYQTFPKACVISIEEIINPELKSLFEEYTSNVNPPNIKRLFHGTLDTIAYVIAEEGFDPSLNKTSAFGKGVYFAATIANVQSGRRWHTCSFVMWLLGKWVKAYPGNRYLTNITV